MVAKLPLGLDLPQNLCCKIPLNPLGLLSTCMMKQIFLVYVWTEFVKPQFLL